MTRGVCALSLFCIAGLLGWAGNAPAPADAPAAPPEPAPIAITPSDGFNLAVADQPDDHYVVVKLTSVAHNWFASSFTNLPTDAPTTIGLNMAGNDTKGNKADVRKWIGLVPVLSYADPTKYESYECFEKGADGLWRSTDVLKSEKEREAGKGKCPEQTAIPKDLAEEFLSKDGKSWEPWREVEKAEAVTAHNVFRITHHFRQATATVAMRVPYTYTYLQQFIERLKAAKLPGVFVDEIGTTPGKRKVQVIRIDDPEHPTPLTIKGFVNKWWVTGGVPDVVIDEGHVKECPGKRVVLAYAREHATEHAGSWTIQGAFAALIDRGAQVADLRRDTAWLLLPIEDPDGSVGASFDRLTNEFWCHQGDAAGGYDTPIEVVAYAAYLRAYANAHIPIGIATSFHCLESGEGPNVSSPFAILQTRDMTVAFDTDWFLSLKAAGFSIGSPVPADTGLLDIRLNGWAGKAYGALPLMFEINDRFPQSRLSLARQSALGWSWANAATHFLARPQGEEWLRGRRSILQDRDAAMEAYWQKRPYSSKVNPRVADMLDMGY